MIKKIKMLFMVIVAAVSLFVVTSCGKDDTIYINEVTHSVFYTPQYLALSLGYFEEEGLKIKLINGGGADKVMASLISGEAHIGLSGPEATIYVYNGGNTDYMINFAQLTKRDGSFIVGRVDEEFTLNSLKNKSILGGRVGGVPEMTLEYVIKEAGLTLARNSFDADVNVRTDIEFNAMVGSFVSGEGDYTTAFEPTASAIERAGNGFVLESVGKYSGLVPYTSYYVKKSYFEKNEDTLIKFTRALYRAQVYLFSHSDAEVAEAIKGHFVDTPVEELALSIKRYREADVWCETPFFAKDGFERLMDIMQNAKELDVRAPYEKIVNNKITNDILK